jgi:hypothetical protein
MLLRLIGAWLVPGVLLLSFIVINTMERVWLRSRSDQTLSRSRDIPESAVGTGDCAAALRGGGSTRWRPHSPR